MAKRRVEIILDHLYNYHEGKTRSIEWVDLVEYLAGKASKTNDISSRTWYAWSDALAKALATNRQVLRQDEWGRIYWRLKEEEATA